MHYINSSILGIVQGLTEFLPVSSTAHLIIIPFLLKIKEELLKSLAFDIFLHGGTLLAVIIYYRDKIIKLIIKFFEGIFNKDKRDDADFKLSIFIILATFPAFVFGYFFKDLIEQIFRKPIFPALFLIIFAVLLFIADRIKNKGKDIKNLNFFDALIIGFFQAIALLPGVSRSGITITAGLFLGYNRKDAAEFSFLLSIPAISGALIFGVKDLVKSGINDNLIILITGFIFAFLSGIIAIKFLLSYVKKFSYLIFVIYRIIFGTLILVFIFWGKI